MNKILLTVICAAVTVTALAQETRVYTNADYERAESMLSYNTGPLIDRADVRPTWVEGDRFWYRVLTATGSEYVLVDPLKKTRTAYPDREKLFAAISALTGKPVEAAPREGGGRRGFRGEGGGNSVLSPDGKRAAFIRDYNLWVRDVATKQETQLTTDGVKDFGYSTDNAGWKSSDRPVLRWSPDGKKIATFKDDQRNVGEMYLVSTKVGHPVLHAWKYPLPGDSVIPMITRVIIDVDAPKVIPLNIPPDPHRATLSDDISSSGTFDDVDWGTDENQLAFVSTSRDHKDEKFRIANALTGEVRDVFEEKVATQFESGRGTIDWRYLQGTHEIIWYSERDNWGHLYLYDASTGQLKNQITKGDWLVSRLVKVDEKKRVIYFMGAGKEPGCPYFNYLYKIGFDGKHMVLLTPEKGNHTITFSPTGEYFVDTYSQPDVAPVSVLRNQEGKLVSDLEKADISRLVASGWRPPIPITVKAHDGQTDLFGLLFVPSHLDSTKKYPIIDYIYPGPQGGSVGNWGFQASRNDNQALTELGFIVVEIEGTSNPYRSKSFHDMSYGNMAENTLPDQVTGIQQLAKKYGFIDVDRVGIWGHSGGGFATAGAMFRYPDFFKVGISESGNHENRNYEDDWGERYDGLLVKNADGTDNYTAQANQNLASHLKGKLMLAHGLMDNNVPPTNTLLVVEALEKANKDYDLVIFPNSPHGYGPNGPYMMRRRWDYFVTNLMGGRPPHEYQMKPKTDPRNAME
ncbi:MAG TPA: DPP IV N-terminal domain-containing protein [Puia sp.]|jgi:dipeptidyl aminopeptidase/acylaminoacyl peptidase|nr:DPP IV N-terminal domain-containing protein [Puia sp.]